MKRLPLTADLFGAMPAELPPRQRGGQPLETRKGWEEHARRRRLARLYRITTRFRRPGPGLPAFSLKAFLDDHGAEVLGRPLVSAEDHQAAERQIRRWVRRYARNA